MKVFNTKEMILTTKGKWLVKIEEDKSNWIIDLDELVFDNYKWYSKVGTLESDLTETILNEFLSNGSWKRLK